MNFSEIALYNLKSKKKLMSLLFFKQSLNHLKRVADTSSYIVRKNIKNNKVGQSKVRLIQEPKENLKFVHLRVAKLLNRLELPKYLHSGRKEHSYKSNAEVHVGRDYVLNIDIENYFPSCNVKMIYRFFRDKLSMSNDVSYLLSDICTYNGFVPTGSPVSQVIAFCASYDMFEDIYAFCKMKEWEMTVYVDDITISSLKPIEKCDIRHILEIISSHGFKHKRGKLRYYPKGKQKEITGVVIYKNQIRAPHKRKKIIFEKLNSYRLIPVYKESLVGRITEVQYLEGKETLALLMRQLR
ncbi:reverse transcriptase family protein [Bacteriovorax sp. Seq25_V]|uniref:reverse transcriptase family protein n=1 Tax=Bacteriovorax sp. Seq25_V TaxID=1201288 RepID=UPI00038A1F1D|nr:reverse transcriptase family protein [Bacteriovorax sp. Seq25_V]EQC47432.1 hypothetical protein M900_0870 [Bacteriovorax sp. Seq25_V]